MHAAKWFMALGAAAGAAALLLSTSVYAGPPGPPPGGWHRPPSFHHRPPPPPPSWHHRPHYRPYYKRWDFWAPLALGGFIATTPLWADPPPTRVEIVPVPVNPAPAAPQSYTWYWCPTEGAFYPGAQTCPVPWEPVTGTSATEPPAPPQ